MRIPRHLRARRIIHQGPNRPRKACWGRPIQQESCNGGRQVPGKRARGVHAGSSPGRIWSPDQRRWRSGSQGFRPQAHSKEPISGKARVPVLCSMLEPGDSPRPMPGLILQVTCLLQDSLRSTYPKIPRPATDEQDQRLQPRRSREAVRDHRLGTVKWSHGLASTVRSTRSIGPATLEIMSSNGRDEPAVRPPLLSHLRHPTTAPEAS